MVVFESAQSVLMGLLEGVHAQALLVVMMRLIGIEFYDRMWFPLCLPQEAFALSQLVG